MFRMVSLRRLNRPVILSEVAASRSEAASQSKDPYTRQNVCDILMQLAEHNRRHRGYRGPSTPHALRFAKCMLHSG